MFKSIHQKFIFQLQFVFCFDFASAAVARADVVVVVVVAADCCHHRHLSNITQHEVHMAPENWSQVTTNF